MAPWVRWQRRSLPTGFADRHTEIQLVSDDRFVLYRCRLCVTEPLKLTALLGYDGPLKLWVDGREMSDDPIGAKPAITDARATAFEANGERELIVGLGTNRGWARRIFVRFERRHVAPSPLRPLAPIRLPKFSRDLNYRPAII